MPREGFLTLPRIQIVMTEVLRKPLNLSNQKAWFFFRI
jgi:hypothetical protein